MLLMVCLSHDGFPVADPQLPLPAVALTDDVLDGLHSVVCDVLAVANEVGDRVLEDCSDIPDQRSAGPEGRLRP